MAQEFSWLSSPIDPRAGDIEDDAASTKSRSLLAVGGRMLAEISLPKRLLAWTTLIGLPAVLLGLAPLVLLGLAGSIAQKFTSLLVGAWSLLIFTGLVVLAWLVGRPLLHQTEQGFWSLWRLRLRASSRQKLDSKAQDLSSRESEESSTSRAGRQRNGFLTP